MENWEASSLILLGAFKPTEQNLKKIRHLFGYFSDGVKIFVTFANPGWLMTDAELKTKRWKNSKNPIEPKEVLATFAKHPNWCIGTICAENSCLDSFWLFNHPSTRTFSLSEDLEQNPVKIYQTTSVVYLEMFGTLGPHCGSYDRDGFLERLKAQLCRLENIDEVVIVFRNSSTTYQSQLPFREVMGFEIDPIYGDLDRVCI